LRDGRLVRILLADDHEIVRRGLRAILAGHPEWEICGEAVNGRQAIEHAKEFKPDLVVMDIGMPELNGLGATRLILKALPKTQVLILTIHESERLVQEVLEAGARGFVLKSDAGTELIAAVEALLEHKLAFTSRVAEIMLRDYLKNPHHRPADEHRLTPREQEIVQLLAEGNSNKEVATRLRISVKTVETHRSHIMTKLNLHNLGELVRYAVRNGIVEA
jgi:DNA-binding NarL/FixJ family response regulator